MSHGKRTKKIQMYLNPEGETDRLILDFWSAVGARRPEVFRRIMRAGIRALLESGEISPELARKAKLHKHLPAIQVQPAQAAPMPYAFSYPMPGPGFAPYPVAPHQPQPAELDEDRAEEITTPPATPAARTRPVEVEAAPVAETVGAIEDRNDDPLAAKSSKHAILGLMAS